MQDFFKTRLGWWAMFLSALIPLAVLVYRILENDLGVEPGKTLLEYVGETAFIFLLITLSITPLNRYAGLKVFVRYRRMIGLYALFYAFLHVISYGLFIVDWSDFVGSLYKRPYVTVGALAFSILIVLGVTSPKVMLRKLGKTWKKLHRLVYASGLLVVVHVWWQSRSDYTEAFVYFLIFLVLMSLRLPFRRKSLTN